jgi:nitrosocyanin
MKKISYVLVSAVMLLASTLPVSAATMAEQQSGYILIQVESHGEAWYVNPVTKTRFYLGRPDDAFTVMKQLGQGIANDQIKLLRVGLSSIVGADTDVDGLGNSLEQALGTNVSNKDSDGDGASDKTEVSQWSNPLGKGFLTTSSSLLSKMRGRILLQVQSHGEAWYVYPGTGRRYFLGRPADAFQVMKTLGKGISNASLSQIPVDAKSVDPGQAINPVYINIKEIKLTAKNYSYSPTSFTVNKGDTVRVVLTSQDSPHGIVIPAYGINVSTLAGETKTLQFTASSAGTFSFHCPHHPSMVGTLIVK